MKKNKFNTILGITFATLVGKVLGIARDMLISYHYGTTELTDAFFLALSIPTMLLGVFTASTDSAIIPQYIRVKNERSKVEADKNFASIINTLAIIDIAVCFVIFIYPSLFVKIFAVGFGKASMSIASDFLRIFAPIGVMHMLYCFFCTYNAAYEKNVARSLLAFLPNMLLVISLFFFPDDRLICLSISYVIVYILCVFIPALEMRKLKYRHYWKINFNNPEYKHFWHLFIPIMGSALLADIQQYVDKNLGSNIRGGISYLNYGNKIISIFDSVLVVGMGVVLLPMLAKKENQSDDVGFVNIASKVTRYLLEVLTPCLGIILVLTVELITILFGRGKFDDNSIYIVSKVMKVYSPLIVFMPLVAIFSKIFQSKEMNKIPFKVNIISVLINVILSILLKFHYGVVGIALATTIATGIEIFIYVVVISRKIGWDSKEINPKILVKLCLPLIISIGISYNIGIWIENIIIKIIVESMTVFIIFICWDYINLKEDFFFWIGKIKNIMK